MTNRVLLNNLKVSGNIRDYEQHIKIYYYEREGSKTDKVVVYFLLCNDKKEYAKRSTFFNSMQDLRAFIKYLAEAYGYFFYKRKKDISKLQLDLFTNALAKDVAESFVRGFLKARNIYLRI